ncbi:TPA: polyprenyl synthetase family protein [Candidatus Micrarchaeota archaeon]|nr:polyprenyl synthetase family protein [Candidatus Micrarchaeota archaeon]
MAFEKMKAFFARWVPEINREIDALFEEKAEIMGEFGEINRKAVLEVTKNFVMKGGKRVRPVLTILGYKGVTGDVCTAAVQTGALMEILHTFLLIHDDICDKDPFRRGTPTVWKSFYDEFRERGLRDPLHHANAIAMITGDIVHVYAYQLALKIDADRDVREKILGKVLEITEVTGYGQNMDIYLSLLPLESVSEEDVLKTYKLKTGIYSVSGPLELGAILAGAEDEVFETYRRYGEKAGVAFQIHDDIIGVFGDPKVTGKPVGSDIREGKRTILVIKAYENADEAQRRVLNQALGNQDAPQDLIEEAAEIIRETGALDYARELEERLAEEAVQILEQSGIEKETREILTEFTEFVMKREK